MKCPRCGSLMYHVHADVVFEGPLADPAAQAAFDNHIGWQCVRRDGGCGFQSKAKQPTLADEGPLLVALP